MPNEPQRRQRLGRPPKAPGDARTELVRVYLSPLERAEVAQFAHACGVREAELMRRLALGHDPRLGPSRVDPAGEAEEQADVRFRLPLAEKVLLDTAARREGLLLGAYLRRAAFERGEPGLTDAAAMRLVYELNAIGNNLNQAVRDAHAGSRRTHDWEGIAAQLRAILTQLALTYVR
ncbi:hypothetical protein Pla108_35250 [Botrimarina colliarenosi]|uniref:Uncharacterized protein n=1 Tax=Botrimarina colliarenosi TaxID=2528001 RepID=A0A5C6A7L9_9BACT|nr:plasmid mobilization relaxosome protein MobC [Botrimarina colliarenosi]TWT95377.1 hypothetical protein Pla108_35250 [Botrimarina colliarenosi]